MVVPEWLSIGLMSAGWVIGARIGWWIGDRYVFKPKPPPEMRDVTPRSAGPRDD
jgi:hypothetical protein